MKLLDTCFLIDLHREARQQKPGLAHGYLRRESDERFAISVVTGCEFLEGFGDPVSGERMLHEFRQFPVDGPIASRASRIRRSLRQQGKLIGDFDILIGATALHHQIPLVTQNVEDFRRIEGLTVESYA